MTKKKIRQIYRASLSALLAFVLCFSAFSTDVLVYAEDYIEEGVSVFTDTVSDTIAGDNQDSDTQNSSTGGYLTSKFRFFA